MVETYIFGHKSPDSDSITSSLVMANLEKELGNSEAKAYRLGNINKETEFISYKKDCLLCCAAYSCFME